MGRILEGPDASAVSFVFFFFFSYLGVKKAVKDAGYRKLGGMSPTDPWRVGGARFVFLDCIRKSNSPCPRSIAAKE